MVDTAQIDAVRAFWDSRPCNSLHSQKTVGTREYFDEVEAKKRFVEPHTVAFADFPRWRGKRVLEVGCGIGTDAAAFARAGADYTGVELSGESLNLARRRFEVYGLSGRFILGDAEQLHRFLEPQTFDLIYSFGVLHHTVNPRRAVAQLSLYAGPDTELKLMLYAARSWKSAMIAAGLDQPEAQSRCPIARMFTVKGVEELLFPYFRVANIEQRHIFPYQVEPYRKGGYVKQPWFASMPDDVFLALEKQFGWHLLVNARPE